MAHNVTHEIEKKIDAAQDFASWDSLARTHDKLSGFEEWKDTEQSDLYDYCEIDFRHQKILQLISESNAKELLYRLNEGVHGNMGGMGHPALYSQALSGTKTLISDYIQAIVDAFSVIHKSPESEISFAEKLDFFRRASHCYGRQALMLSGGGGLIYFHHGVVNELISHNLLPNVISGSSAGAIIAGQLGCLSDEELASDYFINKRYTNDNNTSVVDLFLGKLSHKEIKDYKEGMLDQIVPLDMTFQEAYEKTGRYINISISPEGKHQKSRLMNTITSPNVYVRSAVSASFSVPGAFPSERLFAKGYDGKPRPYLPNRRWVDGSVTGDIPAKKLSRLYGVNQFLVSLINPLVVPFVNEEKRIQRKGLKKSMSESTRDILKESLSIIENALIHMPINDRNTSQKLAYLIRLLEQDYTGDINMILKKKDFKFSQSVVDLTEKEIANLIHAGVQSTWPKIAAIKNSSLISKALDATLEDLNAQSINDNQNSKHHVFI
ncbi:hypothetical protein A9Q99_01820 [Gammaproteobacteria bacterium 45_16_T64]|nr:hypothetical protein A9Q99_01820 [Gammaproteobacteria bacterium 45_16_T64]